MSCVVAVIATYRRPVELARLLASLEKSTHPVHEVVLVDNANDPATHVVAEASALPCIYIEAAENLGCGGGLARAEETALREIPDLTHVWVLDDDVIVEPGTLGLLLETMEQAGAGVACPQASDAEGRLNWFPGLLDRRKFDVVRRAATPAEYLERCGPEPVPFSWATGVALLVGRAALESAGLHRTDFWVRGEDLDFSLRLTQRHRGVYVPTAHVAHHPPGGGLVVNDFPERMKHAAMLQNCAFLFARTKHGRRLARHWPGNAWRHLRRFGFATLGDPIRAFFLGAVCGRTAGVADYFRWRLVGG